MSQGLVTWRTQDAYVASMERYAKKLADNVFIAAPLIKGVKKYDGVIRLDGGREYVLQLEYAMGNEIWFSRGETVSVDTPNTMTSITVPFRNMAVPVTLYWEDEQENKGSKSKIIDLTKTKVKNTENTARNRLEYRSWQAGNTSKMFTGIPDIVGTGTAFGIDGSSDTWWQSQVQTSIGDFDTNGLEKMGVVHTDILSKAAEDGMGMPDGCFGNATFYEAFLQKADQRHYIVKEDAALGPYKGPAFRGTPIYLTPYAPSGEFTMLNFKSLKLIYSVEFELTQFKEPVNSFDRTAHCIFRGAWAPSNRRGLGKGQGITY